MSFNLSRYIPVSIKKFLSELSEGFWFSGYPELIPLDLEKHFREIDRLLEHEQWPFTRADLEVSHAQSLATAFIAKKEQKLAGFFLTHHFGTIGYLDMMIIDPVFQKAGIARPLYFKTISEMKKKGINSFVVHTTNDSAPLIRLLGFKPSQNFTLIARDSLTSKKKILPQNVVRLGKENLKELIDLDTQVFGIKRQNWISTLLDQPTNTFLGLKKNKTIVAFICLRLRRQNALCLDTANALDFNDLKKLIEAVLAHYPDQRIECFVKTDSKLHKFLEKKGFLVPEFFKAIGPLVEWRKGNTQNIGNSEQLQCLSWF